MPGTLSTYVSLLFAAALILTCGIHSTAQAQTVPDSLQIIPPAVTDTLSNAAADTLREENSATDTDAQRRALIEQQQQSQGRNSGDPRQIPQSRQTDRQSVQDAVNFQARDSLTINLRGERIANLFGSGNVRHTSGELSSGNITLDLNMNQVEARAVSPEDTLSYPVLKQGGKDLRSTRILFNYETEKGKFEVAEIEVDDGYLIGTQVKNVSRTEVFVEDGIYSTCPPDHMYYYIRANRMKVVDEEEIFFTNARLYLLDIPYPLVFPFGYVPAGIDRRRSGLLEPTYLFQNSSARGLGLQNLGWFQYFNDYLTGQATVDVFTSGTFFSESRLQYRRTGSFNGNITLGYSSERGLEPTDLAFSETITRRIAITHDQQLNPFSNLSANINLRSADYFRRNSFDIDDRAETSSTSRISYRYSHPEGAFNFSASSNLNQQFSTNVTRLTGPETTFSMRQFSPFKSSTATGADERWYERISVNYRNNFRSQYNFTPLDRDSADVNWFQALLNPSLHREATGSDRHIQLGLIHRGDVSVSQIIPSQFLNVSGGFNMNEYWYPSSTRKRFNEETNRVENVQEPGFVTARDFSTSLSFSTTFYGISQMKIGSFEGLRHTVRPNVSFSYSPDFSEERWGFFREVQTDTLGNTRTYSIFEDEIFRGPSAGEQQTMTFGVSNIFETKRVRRDSTGEVKSANLRLIDNLSVSSSYNFAADSLNFSRVNVSLSSRVVEGIRFSAGANYSFYARNENGTEINRFIWQESNKILQPLSYNLSVSTNIRRGRAGRTRVTTPAYRPYDPFDQSFFNPIDSRFNYEPVQDFTSTFQMGLDFSYRWTYQFGQDARKSAVLNANNIRFNLTPKWSFSTRIGYDFIEGELTPSQFSLRRTMVCWDLSFQFNPFGEFQYYSFRLSLSGGQMQSLFQKLPGLNNLERSSAPGGRRPPRF
ncbi:MAG: LPS-assembly protein LptD [Balneolaceae bacterium]|nr:MAG: LPS-assembly protein LptD [Balneolaceae bacterium]